MVPSDFLVITGTGEGDLDGGRVILSLDVTVDWSVICSGDVPESNVWAVGVSIAVVATDSELLWLLPSDVFPAGVSIMPSECGASVAGVAGVAGVVCARLISRSRRLCDLVLALLPVTVGLSVIARRVVLPLRLPCVCTILTWSLFKWNGGNTVALLTPEFGCDNGVDTWFAGICMMPSGWVYSVKTKNKPVGIDMTVNQYIVIIRYLLYIDILIAY